MESIEWKLLPAFHGLPTLLAKAIFTSQSYTVFVTDLASVWTEALDRKSIGRRSLNEDTSIDPTEGPDQLVMLLTKIKAALDPTAPDHDQTSISLASVTGDDDSKLALNVICHLPDGLKPLKWTFQLTKCPLAFIATELVLPLFKAQHSRAREVQDLIVRLKEKDHVIDKLYDKLEHAGVGLENVFSSLAGMRKPSRNVADEKIKGLAPFSESEWRSKELPSQHSPGDIASLVEYAFPNPKHREIIEVSIHDDLDDWWQNIGPKPIKAVGQLKKMEEASPFKGTQPDKLSRKSRLAADDGDDFQVQATPSQPDSGIKGRTQIDHNATTDDEADTIPDSHPTSSKPSKSRLGAVGKKKIVESHAARQLPLHTAATDDETASGSDAEPIRSPPRFQGIGRVDKTGKVHSPAISETEPSSPGIEVSRHDDTLPQSHDEMTAKTPSPSPSADTQMSKRRVGAIEQSGVQANQAYDQQQSRSKSPEEIPARPAGRRIGAIGKRKLEVQRTLTRGDSQEQEEAESEERRAERKRVELAKELERKAAAKPVKKKRKF